MLSAFWLAHALERLANTKQMSSGHLHLVYRA